MRPIDGSCPGTQTAGVCHVSIHATPDANFFTAARACASLGADVCTKSQMQVLRNFALYTGTSWTSDGADNDGAPTTVGGLGPGQPDDPNPSSDLMGYACCLK